MLYLGESSQVLMDYFSTVSGSLDMTTANRSPLEELIFTKMRRLQKLKEQQAFKGINTEPEILIEIEDLEAEIKQLQVDLKESAIRLEPATSPKAQPRSNYQQPPAVNLKRVKSNSINWTKVGAIAAVISVLIALIALGQSFIFPTDEPTSTLENTKFEYQVRVQARGTGENVSDAAVTIEVGGKAPLDGITDSNGLARISISVSHAGQPGILIVEAIGYKRYTQNIDLTKDVLPKIIQLELMP